MELLLTEITNKVLKGFLSFIKLIIFSNIFVSLCVTAFTHTTYLIYNLPQDNLPIVLTIVFCFSFFTYNIQRFIKFKSVFENEPKLGSRLKWMVKNKNPLIILPVIAGISGLVLTYFLNPLCFLILVPMGALSTFYVVPLFPFYTKSPTLREIPYLKILVIGFVWSLIIIALPTLNAVGSFYFNIDYCLALLQVFLFTIAITLPFDIRDIDYDNNSNLKTIPRYLGVTKTIVLAQILLVGSIVLLYKINISDKHFYGLLIAHIITMITVSFSKKERSELFFAGIIEGLILVLYACVLIAEYCFFL